MEQIDQKDMATIIYSRYTPLSGPLKLNDVEIAYIDTLVQRTAMEFRPSDNKNILMAHMTGRLQEDLGSLILLYRSEPEFLLKLQTRAKLLTGHKLRVIEGRVSRMADEKAERPKLRYESAFSMAAIPATSQSYMKLEFVIRYPFFSELLGLAFLVEILKEDGGEAKLEGAGTNEEKAETMTADEETGKDDKLESDDDEEEPEKPSKFEALLERVGKALDGKKEVGKLPEPGPVPPTKEDDEVDYPHRINV